MFIGWIRLYPWWVVCPAWEIYIGEWFRGYIYKSIVYSQEYKVTYPTHFKQHFCTVFSRRKYAQDRHHNTHLQGSKMVPIVVSQPFCLHFWSIPLGRGKCWRFGPLHHAQVLFDSLGDERVCWECVWVRGCVCREGVWVRGCVDRVRGCVSERMCW